MPSSLFIFGSLDNGETQMRAQRAGTNKLIQARLRAYAEAVKAGSASQDAYEAAKKITRKQLKKAGR